jgi:hypothetical protein
MVRRVPSLHALQPRLQSIMAQFKEMKQGTPTYGAILLARGMEKALLVQMMGKGNDSGTWTFPRGKIEGKDRGDKLECAIREVRLHPSRCCVHDN